MSTEINNNMFSWNWRPIMAFRLKRLRIVSLVMTAICLGGSSFSMAVSSSKPDGWWIGLLVMPLMGPFVFAFFSLFLFYYGAVVFYLEWGTRILASFWPIGRQKLLVCAALLHLLWRGLLPGLAEHVRERERLREEAINQASPTPESSPS